MFHTGFSVQSHTDTAFKITFEVNSWVCVAVCFIIFWQLLELHLYLSLHYVFARGETSRSRTRYIFHYPGTAHQATLQQYHWSVATYLYNSSLSSLLVKKDFQVREDHVIAKQLQEKECE